MKKIIFTISLIIYSCGAYAQSCAGISGSTVPRSYGYKTCVDSVIGRSVLNTVKADTVEVTKLTVTNLTDGLVKSVGDVLTPAVAGTDYVAPSSIGSLVQEADATNFVTGATIPYFKNKSYVGKLFGWDFTNGTTGWTSSGSGTTWALSSNYLQASGGGGASDYTNYYYYSYQFQFVGQQPELINFIPTVNATNAGEGLGVGIKSIDGIADYLVKIDLSATGTRGQLKIYSVVSGSESLLATSASNLSFTTNTDNLSIKICKRPDGFVDAKVLNNTTGLSVSVLYSTAVTGYRPSRLAIYHFGGTQKIPVVNLKNVSQKYKKTILIGDSITNGFGSIFITSVKGDAYLEAGSGATSADLVSSIDEFVNAGSQNAIIMIGMNDAGNSVSSSNYMINVRKVVNAVREAGMNPIICYVTPSNNAGRNVFIQAYNAALLSEYNSIYTIVDTYSILSVGNNLTGLLQPGYNSGDDIHPNGAGNSAIVVKLNTSLINIMPSNQASTAEANQFTANNTFNASTTMRAIVMQTDSTYSIGTSSSAGRPIGIYAAGFINSYGNLNVINSTTSAVIATFGSNNSTGRIDIANAGGGTSRRQMKFYSGTTENIRFDPSATSFFNNALAIKNSGAATAYLHLGAGTTAATTAPLKFTTGTLNTTAEAGAAEYNNSFYLTKNSALRFGLGGSIFDAFADAGNSTTTETDLHTYTTPASTLEANGGKIWANYAGTFVSSATATRQMKVYFAGTAIFDSGTLTISASAAWDIKVNIIRVSSTVVRYTVTMNTQNAALASYTAVGELTGLTLSNTNIIKITGQSAGVGAATNDIVLKLATGEWKPVAAN